MADRYWVGGAGTWNSSSTANWSATSGGASGASAPTSADNVFFDSATTYTVTCSGGNCANWTVSAGTVTFNVTFSGTVYANCYGNISITAATLFTAPTNGYGTLSHQPSSGATTVTFGSSTTNTQKIAYSCSASGITSLTWCNAATQTFNSVDISINKAPFTCAGSTITVDNQDRVTSGLDDTFNLGNVGGMSVGATTIRMGTTTANGGNTRANFTIQSYPSPATEPTLTNFNVTYIRTYNRTQWNTKWFDNFGSGSPFRFGALTFLSNNTNTHTIVGVYGTNSTFTATNINLNFRPQWTGAVTFTGAFALAGSLFTYDTESGFSTPTSITFASTVTNTVSSTVAGDLDLSQVSAPITFTGAVNLTGTSTDSALLNIQNLVYTTLFSSTINITWGYFYVLSNNITFSASTAFTDPSYINAYAGTTFTISNALSVTGSATLPDAANGTFSFSGATLSTSSTVTNFTFTNARVVFDFSNAMTISNPVSLVNNGGLYFRTNDLTLTSALSSTGASTYNILACIDSSSGRTLTLNNAVTLVNCYLAAGTITVLGGATRNFAYSLSTPVPNTTNTDPTTYFWGSLKTVSYPEIAADTFTLSTSGGTFSIAGGGSAIYRTFVRPFTLNNSPAMTMSLAVNPTLTDVDFWRVTPAGAASRPWTGTRLGTVGTVTNITPAAAKTVYWVTGAGAWDAAKWATSSGGAGSVLNYPLPQDNVIFDANSGTGNITYPASIRVGSFIVNDVPAGTTAVYCNTSSITTNNAPAYLWVSKDIYGPPSATGTFVLGNTSTDTYNSFNTGYIAQGLVIADSSSSDTHTVSGINTRFMPYGTLQFATLGTTSISNSLTEPLYILGNYNLNNDTYTINITANQIGSSSYDYSNAGGSYIALGTTNGYSGAGTVNYGSCNMYTYSFYSSSLTSNTAYSVYVYQLISNSSTLGNVNFNQGTNGFTAYQLTVNQATTILNLSVLSKSNSTGTTLRVSHFGSVPRNISMYSFTATYSGSLTTMAVSQNGGAGKPTFVKLGGGNVSVSGVNVTNIDASPASTWYTTGTITTSTGWNSGSIAQGRGTFLLFN